MKVYEYKGCGTCRKALKFLGEHDVPYEKIAIRDTPPSMKELKQVLAAVGDSRKLFNTSGGDYREMGLKDKLDGMADAERLKLLAANGNLIKRPFVVTDDGGLGRIQRRSLAPGTGALRIPALLFSIISSGARMQVSTYPLRTDSQGDLL